MSETILMTVIWIVLWLIILFVKSKSDKNNIGTLQNNSIQNKELKTKKFEHNEENCYYCGSSYNDCSKCPICNAYKCKICGKCNCK